MANQTLGIIQSRRSVREYKPDVVSKEQIDALVDAALASPSANNQQAWHLNVITNADLLNGFDEAIVESLKGQFPDIYKNIAARGGSVLYHAPLLMLVAIPSQSNPVMDAGILVENIAIAAKALGLDSVILGLPGMLFQSGPAATEWSKKLEIPDGYKFGIAIAIGTAAEGAQTREYSPDYSKVSYLG